MASEEIIPLDTSGGGVTKSEHIISPILRLYVVVLIIDHASRDHSIINTQPQTMGLDCLSQHLDNRKLYRKTRSLTERHLGDHKIEYVPGTITVRSG